MINFKPSAGPYAHSSNSTTRMMYQVVLALTPALLFAGYVFGPSVFVVTLVCIAAAVISEGLCLWVRGKTLSPCLDGSAALTGLLLAMSLPASFPPLLCGLGAAFAIVVGKQAYGGLGHNLFNPAMLARVFLLVCFPLEMTQWITPAPVTVASASEWLDFDGVSAATVLSGEVVMPATRDLVLGHQAGSLGEVHAIWLLLGGVYLIYRRVITWVIPVFFLLGILAPATLAYLVSSQEYLSPGQHLFSGAVMLGAFFIVTDLVTSPSSFRGQMVYALLGGLLVWLIREFGSYPEGVAFAVLIINTASPLIDHYMQPKRFGAQAGTGSHS
ncbi:RnfABCDGE type electron transport complex subunit D [Vibrio sp. WXL103]|uniref:RnfABCDGE type electron transport complex subunit D n=1 Tax=Vibrio sp. WXL103 TaxID=3450710 RepID=UPI003EC74B6A